MSPINLNKAISSPNLMKNISMQVKKVQNNQNFNQNSSTVMMPTKTDRMEPIFNQSERSPYLKKKIIHHNSPIYFQVGEHSQRLVRNQVKF